MGERGMLWYDETGTRQHMPALAVPSEKVVDTNGAGDIFHGAYIYSALAHPEATWADHFRFARAASAYAIQHLGNETSLPALSDVEAIQATLVEMG